MFVWSLIEMHFAIICASVPALKGFFSAYFNEPSSTKSPSAKSVPTSSGSLSAHKGSMTSEDWPLTKTKHSQKVKAKADWNTITVTERFSVSSLTEKQKRILGI